MFASSFPTKPIGDFPPFLFDHTSGGAMHPSGVASCGVEQVDKLLPRLSPPLFVDPKCPTTLLTSDLGDEHTSRGIEQVDSVSSRLSRKSNVSCSLIVLAKYSAKLSSDFEDEHAFTGTGPVDGVRASSPCKRNGLGSFKTIAKYWEKLSSDLKDEHASCAIEQADGDESRLSWEKTELCSPKILAKHSAKLSSESWNVLQVTRLFIACIALWLAFPNQPKKLNVGDRLSRETSHMSSVHKEP